MKTYYPYWYIILVPILALITAVSNIFVISVWIGSETRNYVTLLLIALSLSDLLTVSLQGIFLPIVEFSKMTNETICVIHDFLAEKACFIFHTWSLLITCLVAFQRFLVCAFPFKAQYIWSNKTSYLTLFVSLLLALALNVPWNLVSDVEIVELNNSSKLSCHFTYLIDVDRFKNEYLPYIRIYGLQIGSLLIVLFSLTFCSYTISRRNVKMLNERIQQKRRRTTIMTCLVMIVFVIGETPTTIGIIFELYARSSTNTFVQWLGFKIEGVVFGNIVIILSYLLNIWVYIAISKSFRQRLYRILTCKRQGELKRNMNISTISRSKSGSLNSSRI